MKSNERLLPDHVVGRGVKLGWANDKVALPPGTATRTNFVNDAVSGRGVKLAFLPEFTVVLSTLVPRFEDSAIANLNELFAEIDVLLRSLNFKVLKIVDWNLSERADGTYRYEVITFDVENAKSLANLLAERVANRLGDNSVRVVVTSANETICEIAA